MPTTLIPLLFTVESGEPIRWNDALVASRWSMHEAAVVTSANQNWIPEFPKPKAGVITSCTDGRWGWQEYSRWPQFYDQNIPHHCCIPRQRRRGAKFDPGEIRAGDILFHDFTDSDWHQDLSTSVLGMGWISSALRDELAKEAERIINCFDKAGEEKWKNKKALGYNLCSILRQAIDRLCNLPAQRMHSIALAAHVQRMSLEIAGYANYIAVIAPRILNPDFHAKQTLHVRGAFTQNASAAQLFFRLGIPVWFIQELTSLIKVHRVIERPEPLDIETTEAFPRIYSGQADLSGLTTRHGDWPSYMCGVVTREVVNAELPPLSQDTAKAADDEQSGEPPAKRQKKEGRAHRGTRGKKKQSSTAVVVDSPSLKFQPIADCIIPPSWRDVLASLEPLPPPRNSASYYFPPPFLFARVSEKIGDKPQIYCHNYVRIRDFCRQRLLDPSIGGKPLTIAEWRDSLFGDYALDNDGLLPMTSDAAAAKSSRARERHQIRENVRRLFAKTGGLKSYSSSDVPTWGKLRVTAESSQSPELRQEILWEVHEVNWRCELRALDTALVGSDSWSSVDRWDRQHQIAAVWGSYHGLSVIPRWERSAPKFVWSSPTAVDSDVNTVRRLVKAFVGLMSRWPLLPEQLRVPPPMISKCSPDELARLQSAAIHFYVRSFIRTFGRLPIPPIHIPQSLYSRKADK